MKLRSLFSFLPLLLLVFGFVPGSQRQPTPLLQDPRLMANGWFAFSAEKEACYLQTYQLAGYRLREMLAGRAPGSRPAAVITDLDETVLDNSAWGLRVMLEGKDYPQYWADWEKAGSARAFPGAPEFFRMAAGAGAEVFYISNRKAENLSGTLRNLRQLGLPFADSAHVLLKTVSSNKIERRNSVSSRFEILMLLGDNLADFDGVWEDAPEAARMAAVKANAGSWGSRYVIFPNPTYGSWRDAIMGYRRGLADSTANRIWEQRCRLYLEEHPFRPAGR